MTAFTLTSTWQKIASVGAASLEIQNQSDAQQILIDTGAAGPPVPGDPGLPIGPGRSRFIAGLLTADLYARVENMTNGGYAPNARVAVMAGAAQPLGLLS